MIKKPITLKLRDGLEARPIALIVQEATQYSSTVYNEVENKKINAKSIMGMMSLQLGNGEELTVVAEGDDEAEAILGVEKLLVTEYYFIVNKGCIEVLNPFIICELWADCESAKHVTIRVISSLSTYS